MRYILLGAILLSMLCSNTLFAQEVNTDSLEKVLKTAKSEEKLQILESLAYNKDVPANKRIEFSQQALEIAKKYQDKKREAFAYICQGIAYSDLRNYKDALESTHHSLAIYEEINDQEGQAKALTQLGRTHCFLMNFDNGLKFFEEAHAIKVETESSIEIAKSLINIGNIKAMTGNMDEAMTNYKSALKTLEESDNPSICSQCYNNIANVYLARGELDKVLPYRLKALKIDRQLNDEWQISLKTYNMAEYYLIAEEPEKALPYIEESKELAKKMEDKELYNDNIELLSWYYKLKKNYSKALEYMEEYAQSNKEIFSDKISQQVSELHVLYETEKKEREKQEAQLRLQKTENKQELLVLSVILILVILSFIVYQYIRKRKHNRRLEEEVAKQTETLRNKNKELTEFTGQLKTAKEKAEESDRLKTAFLHNISHEIRTPMNGILGFTQLLKTPDLSPEKVLEFIEVIDRSGNRLMDIINDVVSVSQLEAGTMKQNIKDFNLKEQMDAIFLKHKEGIEKKGLEFRINYDLPQVRSRLQADADKLETVLSHLIKNAVRFTDKGTIELACTIKPGKKEKEVIEFSVKDSGIGIPEEKQESIFERFVQVDIEDVMARQGAGLGLSICKAYVEMMGGEIWLESKENKGSAFYFHIPFISGDKTLKEDSEIQTKNTVRKNKFQNTLIVEDDPDSRELISILTKSFTKNIETLNTGAEAIEYIRNNPDTDLVFMDIQLPGLNGYEATKRIRVFNKEIIIIAQTAYGLPGDKQKALDAGCNGYVSKPLKMDELEKVLREV